MNPELETYLVLAGCGLFMLLLGYLLGHVGGSAAGYKKGLQEGVRLRGGS